MHGQVRSDEPSVASRRRHRKDHEDCVIIFVVARTRLDRYELLHRQFGHSREVRIVLDRRDGERRTSRPMFFGANRRRMERRQTPLDLTKLGWSVIETVEPASDVVSRES
jgi:hypothetical protein